MSDKNSAIQGLRAWAMMLVITSHCFILRGGGVGNIIFFSLSGFMANCPLGMDDFEYDFFHIKSFLNYYKRKIIKIMPMSWICMIYSTVVLRYFDCTDFTSDKSLLLNMFFIKSNKHFWFLQQTMVFYLVVPLLLLIVGVVKRFFKGLSYKNSTCINLIIFIFYNLLALMLYWISPRYSIMLYGNGGYQPFRIWDFLIGFSFGYLFRLIRSVSGKWEKNIKKILVRLGTVYVLFFLAGTIFTSERILYRINEGYLDWFIADTNPLLVVYAASISILILALVQNKCLINRLLGNRFFVLLGNLSFEMYLIHWSFLSFFSVRELSFVNKFLAVYTISFAIAFVLNKGENHLYGKKIERT